LVPEATHLEAEVVGEVKRCESPGVDQILSGGKISCSEVQKLTNFIWNEDELSEQWEEHVICLLKKGL
jgi:hypothetical protein